MKLAFEVPTEQSIILAISPCFLVGGYHPPTVTSHPPAAQFAALDDLFSRYPILTLVHIVPGLLFMVLGHCSSVQPFAPAISLGTV
jgi:hypothetical protein